MAKRILQLVFALALFWVFWQGIDWLSNAVFTIRVMFLDVILVLILVPVGSIVAWNLGGFLSEKIIEWDQRRGNI